MCLSHVKESNCLCDDVYASRHVTTNQLYMWSQKHSQDNKFLQLSDCKHRLFRHTKVVITFYKHIFNMLTQANKRENTFPFVSVSFLILIDNVQFSAKVLWSYANVSPEFVFGLFLGGDARAAATLTVIQEAQATTTIMCRNILSASGVERWLSLVKRVCCRLDISAFKTCIMEHTPPTQTSTI